MTRREEIINMAVEAGFKLPLVKPTITALTLFADQIEATERLACAKAALLAPAKTDKQEQRIACFNAVMARGEQ